jgi:F-type H+-transporting ATPase subunit b
MRTLLLAVLLASPAAFAAGGEHHVSYSADDDHDGSPNWMDADSEGFVLKSVGFHAINLVLFLGAVVWFGRRPISDALGNRALAIRKELTESARLRDEARQRNEEMAARLGRIEAEIEGLREDARREAANEERKLIERAEGEAARLAAASERALNDEVVRARAMLRKEAVQLAVQLAEATLRDRVDASHQQALARDFLESLKQGGVNRV